MTIQDPTQPAEALPSAYGPNIVLVVKNRTLSRVAVTNDLLIDGCSEVGLTRAQVIEITQARSANGGADFVKTMRRGMSYVPFPEDTMSQVLAAGRGVAVMRSDGTSIFAGRRDLEDPSVCFGNAPHP